MEWFEWENPLQVGSSQHTATAPLVNATLIDGIWVTYKEENTK